MEETTDAKEKEAELPLYKPIAPFPQCLNPPKQMTPNQEILDIFKEVKINIPLLDAIKQIPSYAKFLKDLCTIKRRMHVQKKAFLTEQVSSILKQNTPPNKRIRDAPLYHASLEIFGSSKHCLT